MSFEQDTILRQVKQLARALARLVGLRAKAEDREEARQTLGELYRSLLGLDRDFLRLADAETLARALGHPQRVGLLVRLLEEEAALAAAGADPATEAWARRLALALLPLAAPVPGLE